MEYKIVFKKRFANNLTTVLTYLESEWGTKVAAEFLEKINNAVQLLKTQPFIGAASNKIPGARGLLITKHNRLFYKIEKNTVIIVLLADTRRKDYNT